MYLISPISLPLTPLSHSRSAPLSVAVPSVNAVYTPAPSHREMHSAWAKPGRIQGRPHRQRAPIEPENADQVIPTTPHPSPVCRSGRHVTPTGPPRLGCGGPWPGGLCPTHRGPGHAEAAAGLATAREPSDENKPINNLAAYVERACCPALAQPRPRKKVRVE